MDLLVVSVDFRIAPLGFLASNVVGDVLLICKTRVGKKLSETVNETRVMSRELRHILT